MNTKNLGAAIFGAAVLAGSAMAASPIPSTTATTTYHRTQVDGIGVFYREAGPRDAPTIVLLHGFPSSSRGFDTLIPLLATHYHVVAPDSPSFGQSDAPSPAAYSYTFDHLAKTTDALLEQLKISYYTLYLFDYGAPIGYRIALAHPERLHALIVQNGNAYEVGLGPKWARIAEYWADPKAHPDVVDTFLSYEATKQRHLAGTSHPEAYDPNSWDDEFAHLSRPGQHEIQAALLTITARTSRPTPLGRHGFANTSRRRWSSGARTTLHSSQRERRPTAPICRRRKFICWMPATLRWRRRTTKSAASSLNLWRAIQARCLIPDFSAGSRFA